MIYQNITVFAPDVICYPADAKEGFDRLSFSFPYPGDDQAISDQINSGVLNRYFGPYDSVTYLDDRVVSKMVWNTKQAAESWAAHLRSKAGVVSVETVEIPE
jgi:hypothetical protein